MFPSLRVALSGLEKDAHYCIVLEMAPLSDCRYKFSGSQWVPAGGAEPQSAQRMYIHPDSPALGSHWQAQPICFNKIKLTNNTLDSNGHVSIANQITTLYALSLSLVRLYFGQSVLAWNIEPVKITKRPFRSLFINSTPATKQIFPHT